MKTPEVQAGVAAVKSRFVDLNRLVGIANFVVAALIASSLPSFEENPYLDRTTLGLGLLLCLQTAIALYFERRRRDPFVLLLAFSMVLYFALRLYTLTAYPVSAVFGRFSFDPADANYALTFMLIANVFMYGGLFAVRTHEQPAIDTALRRPATPIPVLGLMVSMIVFTFLLGSQFPGGAPRAITALAGLLGPILVVTMTMVYFFLFRHSLSRTFTFLFVTLLMLETVAHMLWGSRSALVGLIQIFLLTSFAVNGEVKFSKRLVWAGTLLLPLAIIVLVASFALATASRVAKSAGTELDVAGSMSMASAGESALKGPAADRLIGAVLARAGFFDFSAEIIAHRDRYATVINLPAYGRSFVDNILTPGFDLFDQPKIANAIYFVYREWGAPSKRAVAEVPGYQSDQIGIYGEFYVLFGYASLPLFFVFAAGLKWVYARVRGRNPFLCAMMRVVILMLFVRTIDSFGLDWTVGEVLPVALATVLYSVLFASHVRPRATPVAMQN
jgi:hypothetical protein